MSQKLSTPPANPTGFAALVELFDGSFQAVATLLDVASNSIAEDVRQIEAAIRGGDAGAAAEAAHRLKGTSGSISATFLAAIGSAIEEEARRQSLPSAAALVADLCAARDALSAEVAAFASEARYAPRVADAR